jgi:hypothetical protein
MTVFAPLKVASRNSERSSIGNRWCSSSSTKSVRKTAAIAKSARTRADPQAWSFVSMSPYVSPNRPIADVSSPGRSSRCSRDVSLVSSMKMPAASTPRTPIGMLMKKIQLQLIFSVSSPPTSGPNASASAETPAQIPIAVPRWRGGNVAVMIESVAGFINAAPIPWTVRAAMSTSAPLARPHASDDAVKMTSPMMKMRRRPTRSANFPPVSSSTPNVSA